MQHVEACLTLGFTQPMPQSFSIRPMCLALYLCVLAALSGCSRQKEEPASAVEQIEAGVDLLRIFNFKEAYDVLSSVQPQLSEEDEQWPLATYSLGVAAWQMAPPRQERIKQAQELFEAVISHDADSEFASAAMLDLGRIAEVSDYLGDPTDVPLAQSYYQKVRDEFPGTDMATRATLYLAQTWAQTFDPGQVQAAVELLESEMSAEPDSPWMGVLAQYTAQLYAFYLDRPDEAVDIYLKAVEAGLPRPADADVSLWQLGLLAEKAGRDKIAAEVFARMVREYPRSIYRTMAYERAMALVRKHPEFQLALPEVSVTEMSGGGQSR